MRVTEILRVIESMAALDAGHDLARCGIKRAEFDWATWHGVVAADKPIMAGHSLGGSAAVC